MTIRVRKPEGVATALEGRVFLVYYPTPAKLEYVTAAHEDYLACCEKFGGGPLPTLMLADKPVPLAPMDVRMFWRDAASGEPGFGPVALVVGGVVGLMAAAVTHLGEQLVAVLGVSFRSFRHDIDAAEWLCNQYDCEAAPEQLADAAVQLRKALQAMSPPGDPVE